MNSIWGNELSYTPDYWPLWLIIAGLLVLLVLLALLGHALLRFVFKPEMDYGTEHKTMLYSGAIRLWHWCNALLFILLLLSGIFMHFSIASVPAMVTLHKFCGYLLIAFWVGFVYINMKGNGKHYKIKLKGWFGRCWKQAMYYLFGIMKGKSHPFPADEKCKFNPIQQIAYIGVMYLMLPLLIYTGLACAFPAVFAFGQGYWMLKAHLVLALCSIAFMMIHVYLCTTGDTPTQTFKCMVDGYHRHLDNNGPKEV